MTALVERHGNTVPGPHAARAPRFTAMVVVASPFVRETLARSLRALGAVEVVEASSLAEARARALGTSTRDLAVVDSNLPDGSGIALVRELRGLGWVRGLVLSSTEDPYTVRAALTGGVRAFLVTASSGGPSVRSAAPQTLATGMTSVPARYASVQPPTGTSATLLATLDAALAVDPERRLPSMQAFADGLGGRLPTERGRDIGVSAEVGEATARVLSAVVKTAAGVFDAAATSIALRRSDGGLDYQAAWGAGADEVVGMRLRPGQGIAGRVLATGVGEVIQDCRNDPDFAAAVARGTGYVPYTMIVVPLVPDDVAVGVLTVLDKRDGSSYDVSDLARAGMFADLALAAIDAEPGARAALTTAIAHRD